MANKSKIVTRTAQTNYKLYVREAPDGKKPSRKICGYAILFNTPSAPLWEEGNEMARETICPSAITQKLLDGADIKMTLFHDRQLLLARSKNGKGALKYQIDKKGVNFSFDAPNTTDGDKALELVRRGDICGCSFAFSTYYGNRDYVRRVSTKEKGKNVTTFYVQKITGIFDFTLAADPAYPATSVEARELKKKLTAPTAADQIREMRETASASVFGYTNRTRNHTKGSWKDQVQEMREIANGI